MRIAMGYTGTLQKWLETGEVDTALLFYDPKHAPTLQLTPLLEESLWVVGLPGDGLDLGRPVAMSELVRKPLVLPSAPHGIRMLVDEVCALMRVELNIVAETNAMNVQKSLVLGGHGLTILPAIAVADDLARNLMTAAPLTEPVLMRKIVRALPTTRNTTAPVRGVLGLLDKIIKNAVQSGDWPAARWLGG
jgi:DNA-binding transcriptional LysR family regulator